METSKEVKKQKTQFEILCDEHDALLMRSDMVIERLGNLLAKIKGSYEEQSEEANPVSLKYDMNSILGKTEIFIQRFKYNLNSVDWFVDELEKII